MGEDQLRSPTHLFFFKKQVSRETWLGYDHLADGELLQELQVVAHLLTRLQGETVAPPVSLWGLESVRICGSRILETVLTSHLPPPHPPYSGLAISAQARLEQSELVTSGVEWAPKTEGSSKES